MALEPSPAIGKEGECSSQAVETSVRMPAIPERMSRKTCEGPTNGYLSMGTRAKPCHRQIRGMLEPCLRHSVRMPATPERVPSKTYECLTNGFLGQGTRAKPCHRQRRGMLDPGRRHKCANAGHSLTNAEENIRGTDKWIFKHGHSSQALPSANKGHARSMPSAQCTNTGHSRKSVEQNV